MKTPIYFAAACVCFAPLARATINITVDAGVLRSTATGGATVPTGGLLQIIATRSGSISGFSAPAPGKFVTGDNYLVASFTMNYNGGPGESVNTFQINFENLGTASSTMFDAGDPLLLRFYPTLTLSSTGPSDGTVYGQVRSDTADGTSTGPNGNSQGIAWFAPTDSGQTLSAPNGLNYFTTETSDNNGVIGTHAPATAYAAFAVPEPSTYAFFGLGLAGLTFGAMQERRRRQGVN